MYYYLNFASRKFGADARRERCRRISILPCPPMEENRSQPWPTLGQAWQLRHNRATGFVGEKEITKGDILVAKAADPGWIPLFLNAQGILLEVGGMLQHGSLIAREYGKPCIAGIEDLMQHIKDGNQLEMNGATGLVHIIPK